MERPPSRVISGLIVVMVRPLWWWLFLWRLWRLWQWRFLWWLWLWQFLWRLWQCQFLWWLRRWQFLWRLWVLWLWQFLWCLWFWQFLWVSIVSMSEDSDSDNFYEEGLWDLACSSMTIVTMSISMTISLMLVRPCLLLPPEVEANAGGAAKQPKKHLVVISIIILNDVVCSCWS